jgi:hypothetical protein
MCLLYISFHNSFLLICVFRERVTSQPVGDFAPILREWIPHLNKQIQQLHDALLQREITNAKKMQSASSMKHEDDSIINPGEDSSHPESELTSASDSSQAAESETSDSIDDSNLVNPDFLRQLCNPFYKKDPLKLDPDFKKDISMLASLCIEYGVFGDISRCLGANEAKDDDVVFVRCFFFLWADADLRKIVLNTGERREKLWNSFVDCEEGNLC